MIYGYPDVGRVGLGHGLLAWGRCVLWCEAMGAVALAPRWLRLRIGPYLRRERDKRAYVLLFHAGQAIGGLRRMAILKLARRVPIEEYDGGGGGRWPLVVEFPTREANDPAVEFGRLKGHGPLLRDRLEAMTRPRYRPAATLPPHIAIHVRRGDFTAPIPEGAPPGRMHNRQLPIAWYCRVLKTLRQALGERVPAIVYSDGSDEELAPLLIEPHVARAAPAAAITDMLTMAQAGVLIASGSGFSLWGSLLGSVPRIAHPGQSLASVLADPALEIEADGHGALPAPFVAAASARLGHGRGPGGAPIGVRAG